MTAPHPRATGSYGPEFCVWSERRSGRPLRWWQRLAACRILEHDQAGTLVWKNVLLSTSRQVGKSVLLSEIALWRLHQEELFGEPQLCLLVSKDLNAAREVHRTARLWARQQDGWSTREANGQEEVTFGDNRWIVRGEHSVYSYAASLAIADESWDLEPGVISDGIEPTTAARHSPQVLLVSTAHREATPLIPRRRTGALEQLEDPQATLLLEWSASVEVDLSEVAAWRAASPHWTQPRRELIEDKLTAALAAAGEGGARDAAGSFRTQWLNQWPAAGVRTPGREEHLCPVEDWAALVDLNVGAHDGPTVAAVEDFFGKGACVAIATLLPDGTVDVFGRLAPNRKAAFAAVSMLSLQHEGLRLLVGASLAGDPDIPVEMVASVTPAGSREMRAGLSLLRELVTAKRLHHDGGKDLAQQVTGCRVREMAEGLAVGARSGRTDLVRALAWSLLAVTTTPEPRRASWAVV